MPLTPDEAIAKNQGKLHLQMERALEDLMAELEEAIEYYTGAPVYVGLPAYLQYKVQADSSAEVSPATLNAVIHALHDRFAPAGWKVGFVNNDSGTYYWARLKDARDN